MATPFDNLPDPVELTLTARALIDVNETSNWLSAWFPRITTRDNRYSIDSLNTGTAQVAAVRAFDARPVQLERSFGQASKDGRILPTSAELEMNELALILERAHADDELVAQAYDDVAETTTAVWNRIRQMQAEAVVEGSLTFTDATDPGMVVQLDFGDTANRRQGVVTAWSDNAAPAFDDALAAAEAAADLRGEGSSYMVMSRTKLRQFLTNDQVKSYTGTTLPRASRGDVDTLFADEGLPPIYVFDETLAGNRLIPTDIVMFMPTTPSGNLVEGTTAEVASGRVALTGNDRAGIVSVIDVETRPTRLVTWANALSFPVCNPDAFYRLDTSGA